MPLHPTAILATAALTLSGSAALALHGEYEDHGYGRQLDFPDAPDGSKLLTADLHTHTVFSDGHVWPSIRVEEADRDGLDALAITDHLEHQPKKDDIPHPDRNRSHEVAREHAERAEMTDVMLIRGAEITRGMPPGHVNGVFLEDANALLTDDAVAAIEAANDQGAFVFWNHPNWLPQMADGIARLMTMHKQLIRDGKLHGIEVANGTLDSYSEHALGIALEYDLTILATSDIHGLVDWTHEAGHGGHRPMTIVLAPEKSPQALKQALFDGRTVAWNYDDLIGRSENVDQVVRACLRLEPEEFVYQQYVPDSKVLKVALHNDCPLPFTLRNIGELTFDNVSDVIRVEKNDHFDVNVRMGGEKETVELQFTVLNTQVRPREHLDVTLSAAIETAGE